MAAAFCQAFVSHVSTTFVRAELARANILFLTDNLSDLFREIPIPRPLAACQSETPLGGNPCEFGLGSGYQACCTRAWISLDGLVGSVDRGDDPKQFSAHSFRPDDDLQLFGGRLVQF